MHPTIYGAFERICSDRRAGGGRVLEIGAVPAKISLLNLEALRDARQRIGVNLTLRGRFGSFEVVQANANALPFADAAFDTVLSNATLEHDARFWRTLAEVRRVVRPGGLVVIGVPAFMVVSGEERAHSFIERLPLLLRKRIAGLANVTPTFKIHDGPGDYYRFSPQAMREVFFDGFREVRTEAAMLPPRLIGSGLKA